MVDLPPPSSIGRCDGVGPADSANAIRFSLSLCSLPAPRVAGVIDHLPPRGIDRGRHLGKLLILRMSAIEASTAAADHAGRRRFLTHSRRRAVADCASQQSILRYAGRRTWSPRGSSPCRSSTSPHLRLMAAWSCRRPDSGRSVLALQLQSTCGGLSSGCSRGRVIRVDASDRVREAKCCRCPRNRFA
jgi:hypothetical protein